MLISTRSRYALRALAEMVLAGQENPLSLNVIADNQHISIRYLEQIFGRLRAAGIVKGRRGPGGGYTLIKPPGEISLLELVGVLEANFLPRSCIEDGWECGIKEEHSGKCTLEDTCVTKDLWAKLKNVCQNILMNNTLEDLAMKNLSESQRE